jgi:hypothetical protein
VDLLILAENVPNPVQPLALAIPNNFCKNKSLSQPCQLD